MGFFRGLGKGLGGRNGRGMGVSGVVDNREGFPGVLGDWVGVS